MIQSRDISWCGPKKILLETTYDLEMQYLLGVTPEMIVTTQSEHDYAFDVLRCNSCAGDCDSTHGHMQVPPKETQTTHDR